MMQHKFLGYIGIIAVWNADLKNYRLSFGRESPNSNHQLIQYSTPLTHHTIAVSAKNFCMKPDPELYLKSGVYRLDTTRKSTVPCSAPVL